MKLPALKRVVSKRENKQLSDYIEIGAERKVSKFSSSD